MNEDVMNVKKVWFEAKCLFLMDEINSVGFRNCKILHKRTCFEIVKLIDDYFTNQ